MKLPTGGKCFIKLFLEHKPASAFLIQKGSSRSGEIPEPTVTVRMKESNGLLIFLYFKGMACHFYMP